MTKKLLLTIALGGVIAVLAAGTASSVDVDWAVPRSRSPPGGALPACSDLSDNDGDGAIDLTDPGCSSPLDTDEYNPPPAPTPAPTPGSGGPGARHHDGSHPRRYDGPRGRQGHPSPAARRRPRRPPAKASSARTPPRAARASTRPSARRSRSPPERAPDGSPTNANAGLTIAQFGAAPLGVPNFVIDQFEIPPFLLPIYHACGTEYGIPWQVLASINRIETAFGTNLNVSSAGAMGWMQFIPSSWQAYGVDANDDGRKDPYNPVDAICAAARYLKAAGWADSPRDAVFAYNHADWYVDEVLMYANQYAKLPDDLVGSLTGLTEGAHFPVAADARYADDISEREVLQRSKENRTTAGNAADVISDSPTRRGIDIYSRVRAPVVAVNDGVIQDIGQSPKLGNYIVLMDAYGNRYTYAELGEISEVHPVPKETALTSKDFELIAPEDEDGNGAAPARTAPPAPATTPRPRPTPRRPTRPPTRQSPPSPPPRSTPRSCASASSPTPSARPTPSAPASAASSMACSASGCPPTRPSRATSRAPSSSTPRRCSSTT